MSLNRLYYMVRPLINRHLQIFLRRQIIRKTYNRYKHVWPILPHDISPPEWWEGWPDGKRFSLVLTHDVEMGAGQDRVPGLMGLEQDLGFTSSFNFVPERYEVSEALREMLTRNGFEVGVHDLKHDGKLYDSEEVFLRSAVKINGYLKKWGAVGFRSGAMHHDLDLIHALDIEYDASTFDFDPFEPQPDGVGTIYPFWVSPNHRGKGYVELPYTLPQDFTLFVLMQEKSIDIWKRKLDWIASRGGMALVNTHPDYMCFDGMGPRFDEYPIQLYRDFLEFVKSNYAGQYWNANPREIAGHIAGKLGKK